MGSINFFKKNKKFVRFIFHYIFIKEFSNKIMLFSLFYFSLLFLLLCLLFHYLNFIQYETFKKLSVLIIVICVLYYIYKFVSALRMPNREGTNAPPLNFSDFAIDNGYNPPKIIYDTKYEIRHDIKQRNWKKYDPNTKSIITD